MEKIRKPFQGVFNIVRFNWHFYVLSFLFIIVLLLTANYTSAPLATAFYAVSSIVLLVNLISLIVSCYVYDFSGLYALNWIKGEDYSCCIVNIHAGFDETSVILRNRFINSSMEVLDFYDPAKHTEVSIKRARKAYPSFPGTKEVTTMELPLADNSADKIFVILSAHEIRNEVERITFFKELKRMVKPDGEIFIVEHLRDAANFLAYSVGAFHFHSRAAWFRTFHKAQLKVAQEIKLTPFISTFILTKNGHSS